MDIPEERVVVLVSTDLQARVRVEAAVNPLGVRVEARRPDDGRALPAEAALVVLDLDQVEDVAAWVETAGPLPGRVLGFFSHVQEEKGAAARAAGIEAHPRGRFWRRLAALLA